MSQAIIITGFMGSGKSTLAKHLAKKLPNMVCVDLDSFIEKETGLSIKEIFIKYGEQVFRKLESRLLSLVLKKFDNFILSLGGGTFASPHNIRLIQRKTNGIIIFLDTPFPIIWERIQNDGNRPLVRLGYNKVKELFLDRRPYYKKGSNLIINKVNELTFVNPKTQE